MKDAIEYFNLALGRLTAALDAFDRALAELAELE